MTFLNFIFSVKSMIIRIQLLLDVIFLFWKVTFMEVGSGSIILECDNRAWLLKDKE